MPDLTYFTAIRTKQVGYLLRQKTRSFIYLRDETKTFFYYSRLKLTFYIHDVDGVDGVDVDVGFDSDDVDACQLPSSWCCGAATHMLKLR